MGIVTGRNEVVAKVMFSLVCVILLPGGGIRGKGGHVWQRGVCMAKGGVCGKGEGGHVW